MSDIIKEIEAERCRQVEQEGWTAEHDDQHTDGSLAAAAASYAWPTVAVLTDGYGEPLHLLATSPDYSDHMPLAWPHSWDFDWWKPTSRRRDLIKAAALIIAEIERLDRAAWKKMARDRCDMLKIAVKNIDEAEAVGISFSGQGTQTFKMIHAQRRAAA